MSIIKDSRVSSLLSLGSTSPAESSQERPAPPVTRGLRPLPASRDGTAPVHSRLPSIQLHTSRSSQNLAPRSRDTSPALRSSSSTHNFQSLTPNTNSPSYTSLVGLSPWGPPAYQPLDAYASPNGHSPASIASVGALPTTSLASQGQDDLVPPPRMGELFYEQPPSPAGSRDGSVPRGRQDNRASSLPTSRASSPVQGSAGSRPVTPPEGKLTKKRGWLPGRSHNRSGSEASLGQSPQAWVVTPHGQQSYDISYLLKAQPVSDLQTEEQPFRGY